MLHGNLEFSQSRYPKQNSTSHPEAIIHTDSLSQEIESDARREPASQLRDSTPQRLLIFSQPARRRIEVTTATSTAAPDTQRHWRMSITPVPLHAPPLCSYT
ncbi:hypothetical protein E2P81_ATG10057 [Venturia nashicola]|nr:hypothetical protein E2P81_ATG10057 [Venturia nashicola]